MMMTIQPPKVARRRRRRRVAVAGLVAIGLVLTGGAWARAQGRYVLLVVDSRTGEVVTRADPDVLKLPAAPKLDWKAISDRLLRAAAGGLARRLQAYADEEVPPAPPRPAAVTPAKAAPVIARVELAGGPPVLAGGPPRPDAPAGLKIIVTDSWAQPSGVLSAPD